MPLTPFANEVKSLMAHAEQEIMQLRRRLEILEARDEVFQGMMQMLHTRAAYQSRVESIDIAWQLREFMHDRLSDEIQEN